MAYIRGAVILVLVLLAMALYAAMVPFLWLALNVVQPFLSFLHKRAVHVRVVKR
jgi:hypothetical protein